MPKDTTIIFEKGRELLKKGKPKSALEKFNQVVRNNPDFELAWIYKVTILDRFIDVKKALKAANDGLRIHPSSAELWKLKASALMNINTSTYEETIFCCKEALRLKPDEYLGISASVNARFKHYQEAVKCLERVIELNPTDYAVRLKLAYQDAIEYGHNYYVPLWAFSSNTLLHIPPSNKIIDTTRFKVKNYSTTMTGKARVKISYVMALLTEEGV